MSIVGSVTLQAELDEPPSPPPPDEPNPPELPPEDVEPPLLEPLPLPLAPELEPELLLVLGVVNPLVGELLEQAASTANGNAASRYLRMEPPSGTGCSDEARSAL